MGNASLHVKGLEKVKRNEDEDGGSYYYYYYGNYGDKTSRSERGDLCYEGGRDVGFTGSGQTRDGAVVVSPLLSKRLKETTKGSWLSDAPKKCIT